mgnify:CR=1 FL=1
MTVTDHRPLDPLRSVDELLALLHRARQRDEVGDRPDRVGIFEHGLQCADVLRRARPDDLDYPVISGTTDLQRVHPDLPRLVVRDAVETQPIALDLKGIGEEVEPLPELEETTQSQETWTRDNWLFKDDDPLVGLKNAIADPYIAAELPVMDSTRTLRRLRELGVDTLTPAAYGRRGRRRRPFGSPAVSTSTRSTGSAICSRRYAPATAARCRSAASAKCSTGSPGPTAWPPAATTPSSAPPSP